MKSDLICEDLIQFNLKLIHSHIVSNHLSERPPNKVLQDQTPSVSPAELLLSRETRRTLAQLRTNKSPLLVSYLFSIGDPRHPSPLCPLCLMHDHTSSHLFECKSLPTSLSSLDLWTNPDKVEPFLATWGERLLAATWFGCWTLLAARWWSGVDNNNNNIVTCRQWKLHGYLQTMETTWLPADNGDYMDTCRQWRLHGYLQTMETTWLPADNGDYMATCR